MQKGKKTPAVAVVGPTASGKTALAAELALRLDGEVISADSMQIFRNMPVASAAPTKEEMRGVPHHLVGICDAGCEFSVSEFTALATKTALDIYARGHLPIVAGGTGLYVDALVNNYNFAGASPNIELRRNIEAEYDALGGEKMLANLRELDPAGADKLHPNDKKRIVRAFELIRGSGTTVTAQNALTAKADSPFDFVLIGLTFKDRQKLYDRINRRVDIMLKSGLEAEARRAYESNKKGTGAQAIGHKEFYEYFKGNQSLDEAINRIKTETRHLAKRQLTWFGRNPLIDWIYLDETENPADAAEQIIKEKM